MERVLALAATEVRLILRNRTVLVSAVALPLAIGAFWAFSGGVSGNPASAVAMQLAIVLGMGVYLTATQTLVARREALVLKRMRTSGISDAGLLAATIAPPMALALVQLVIFAVVDVVGGLAVPTQPWVLVLAILGGLALTVTAALATTVVTGTAERAGITTLPLFFLMMGGAIVMALIPLDGPLEALVLIPGAALGALARNAFEGGMSPLTLVALVVWPVLFGLLAKRSFRWESRVAAA